MRILYFGLPLGAVALAGEGFPPVAACLGYRRAPGTRRLRSRLARGGTLLLGRPDLRDPKVRELLASTRPDAILSFFYPRRIPPEVLSLAPRGAFGTHPSLLPRWRGPDPCYWALRAGDRETGVSLHRLEAEYDTGAVVATRRMPIRPTDDAWSLARRLDRPALALLAECARRLASGEALPGEPQDERTVTLAPRPTDQELAADFALPGEEVVRLVRAASPWPGASVQLGEEVVEVRGARLAATPPPAALEVGEAFSLEGGIAVVAGDRRAVILEHLERDGEPLTAEEALALARPAVS